MNQQWGPKGCAGWGPFDAVTNALRQPRRVASQLAVAMVRDWLTVLAVPCGSVILTAPPGAPGRAGRVHDLAPDRRAVHPILAGNSTMEQQCRL